MVDAWRKGTGRGPVRSVRIWVEQLTVEAVVAIEGLQRGYWHHTSDV
jgi:hypothetical protein